MTRSVLAGGVLVAALAAVVAACESAVEVVPDERDAGASDAGTGGPIVSSDGALPRPDATVLDATSDVSVDAAHGSDASDASTDAAGDASDANAPAAPVTVATIAGLLDFDFTSTALAARTAAGFYSCALPGCATLTGPFVGLFNTDTSFSVAGGRMYFVSNGDSAQTRDLYSVALDGTGRARRSPPRTWTGSMTLVQLLGGTTNASALFRAVPTVGAGRFEFFSVAGNPAAPNADRAARVGTNQHENVGATVSYVPAQNPTGAALFPATMTTTGATLPLPAMAPSAVGVSARGPSVAHPAVVIVRGGRLEACPTTTNCAAWRDLGPLPAGATYTLDGEHLYVGDASGLSRCALAEIETLGTCTLVSRSTEAVSAPLYATATELFYRHGDDVRRVAK